MQPAITDLEAFVGRCIPYRSTTPGQRTQAVVWVANELSDLFPTLPLGKWALAFQGFQPDLWEDNCGVRLTPEDLAPFTDYLAHAALVPGPDASVCACAHYLAWHAVNSGREAARVLADPEAGLLLARHPRLRHLLGRMADGDGVASRVLRRTTDEPEREIPDPAAAEPAD